MSERELSELTAHLCTLVAPWTQDGLHSDETKADCRRVGERLNKIGGMEAMINAYYEAKASNRCASVVQAYWDGIGDWQW